MLQSSVLCGLQLHICEFGNIWDMGVRNPTFKCKFRAPLVPGPSEPLWQVRHRPYHFSAKKESKKQKEQKEKKKRKGKKKKF